MALHDRLFVDHFETILALAVSNLLQQSAHFGFVPLQNLTEIAAIEDKSPHGPIGRFAALDLTTILSTSEKKADGRAVLWISDQVDGVPILKPSLA